MGFLETLSAHTGGLIHLTELYWYDGRGWDGVPDRICLVLDVSADVSSRCRAEALAASCAPAISGAAAAVLLLIDDRPQWIWVTEADVELL